MKRIHQITAITILSLLGLAGAAHAANWTAFHGVSRILVHDDALEVTLVGDTNCNRTYRLSVTADNYEVMSTALMSAYFAGHEVSVDFTGTEAGNCATSLHRVKVRP